MKYVFLVIAALALLGHYSQVQHGWAVRTYLGSDAWKETRPRWVKWAIVTLGERSYISGLLGDERVTMTVYVWRGMRQITRVELTGEER